MMNWPPAPAVAAVTTPRTPSAPYRSRSKLWPVNEEGVAESRSSMYAARSKSFRGGSPTSCNFAEAAADSLYWPATIA